MASARGRPHVRSGTSLPSTRNLNGPYGVAAFALGLAVHTPYPDLFHGEGFWRRLPFWLQGSVIGALGLIPAALLVHIGVGVLRVRRARLRSWGA